MTKKELEEMEEIEPIKGIPQLYPGKLMDDHWHEWHVLFVEMVDKFNQMIEEVNKDEQ